MPLKLCSLQKISARSDHEAGKADFEKAMIPAERKPIFAPSCHICHAHYLLGGMRAYLIYAFKHRDGNDNQGIYS